VAVQCSYDFRRCGQLAWQKQMIFHIYSSFIPTCLQHGAQNGKSGPALRKSVVSLYRICLYNFVTSFATDIHVSFELQYL